MADFIKELIIYVAIISMLLHNCIATTTTFSKLPKSTKQTE